MNFQFCTHVLSIDWNKSPLQISRKVAKFVARTLETNFQGTHVVGKFFTFLLRKIAYGQLTSVNQTCSLDIISSVCVFLLGNAVTKLR